MANFVLVEDSFGDVIDVNVYCSDACAQTDAGYDGWYGCQQVEFGQFCHREGCHERVLGFADDPDEVARWTEFSNQAVVWIKN
jgi:hypothetical protein